MLLLRINRSRSTHKTGVPVTAMCKPDCAPYCRFGCRTRFDGSRMERSLNGSLGTSTC